MTVPDALRDRHLRRYRLRRQRLPTARGTLSLVTPVGSDELLRARGLDGGAPVRPRDLPYWADLWPASVGLARSILRGPDLDGCRVLDLGCGVGAAGVAAGLAGAAVLFVDRESDALRFAAFNARHNRVRADVLRADWSRDPLPGPFDHVLMADVSYEADSHGPLLAVLERVLAPGAVAWHVDPHREESTRFLDRARRVLAVEETAMDTSVDGTRIPLRSARLARP